MKLRCPNCDSYHISHYVDKLMEINKYSCVSCGYQGRYASFMDEQIYLKDEINIEKEFNEWNDRNLNEASACDAFIAGYELAKKMGEK